MEKIFKLFLCGLVCASVQVPKLVKAEKEASATKFDDLTLWYSTPSGTEKTAWEKKALPIGNGYMGAKIFGNVQNEKIQFNEKTLWSGGPGENYTGGNTRSKDNGGASLREIQNLISQGNFEQAKRKMSELQGNESRLGDYQNFGFINFEFTNLTDTVSEYTRSLDLKSAISNVNFNYDNVNYAREYFMSYPDRVMVSKMSADVNNKINFKLSLESAQDAEITTEDNNTIVMKGDYVKGKSASNNTYPDKNDMKHAAVLKVVPENGTLRTENGKIIIENADSVIIYMSAATNYKNEYPTYRGDNNPVADAKQRVIAAATKGYDAVKQAHETDYKALFERVKINVGQTGKIPATDELLTRYKNGEQSKQLEMLYYQFGRYLLISSSREGSLPANLQGVWNTVNNPPWQSDYHLNVNLQMNYWPAYTSNLAETAKPLVSYVDLLRKPGRITANMYTGIGADNEDGTPNPNIATGWMAHTQNGPMGNTGPGSSWQWGWAPTAGAWILQNTYDYYAFTKDINYLEQAIYPAMEESALMWSQLLIEEVVNGQKTGRLISSPTYSPEHGPVEAGNTFDQELIWQLYTNTIEAAKVLQANGKSVNTQLITKLEQQLPKLKPLAVGSFGQIKEWPNEDEWENRGVRSKSVQLQHRHMSHLLGLWPGNHITKNTENYLEAAKVSLNDRGNGGTGWSKAQKIGAWARALDGTRSHLLFEELLKHSTLDNLWDTHPPFQIDGNFGAIAGINEWFVQSHTGKIELLPALPEQYVATGNVKGLLARGNFEINLEWTNDSLQNAKVISKSGEKVVLSYPNISTAIVTKNGATLTYEVIDKNTITFDTEKASEYIITNFQARPLRAVSSVKGYIVDTNKTIISGVGNEAATSYTLFKKQEDGTFIEVDTQAEFYFEVANDDAAQEYKVSANKGEIKGDLSSAFTPLELRGHKKLDDRSPLIRYSDGWKNWSDAQQYGGTEKYANNGGTYLFIFSGTGFKIIGPKNANLGAFDVYIDGSQEPISVSAHSNTKQIQAVLYEKTDLAPGMHFVYVRGSDREAPRYKMSLDAIEILGAPKLPLKSLAISSDTDVIQTLSQQLQMHVHTNPENAMLENVVWSVTNENGEPTDVATIDQNGVLTPKKEGVVSVKVSSKIDDTHPEIVATKLISIHLVDEISQIYDDRESTIHYVGQNGVNWSTWNEAKHQNGTITEIYSKTKDIAGSYFEIPFTGTGISLNFTKLESSSIFAGGKIEIFIDNVSQGIFDTFTTVSGSEPKARIFEKHDLTAGDHIAKVVVKGATDQVSNKRPKVTFDYYEVFTKQNKKTDQVAELDYTVVTDLLQVIAQINFCDFTKQSTDLLYAQISKVNRLVEETTLTQELLNVTATNLSNAIDSLVPAGNLEYEDEMAYVKADAAVANENYKLVFTEIQKPEKENYEVKKAYQMQLICDRTKQTKELNGSIKVKLKNMEDTDMLMQASTNTILEADENGFVTITKLDDTYLVVSEIGQLFAYEDEATHVKLNADVNVVAKGTIAHVIKTDKKLLENPNSRIYDITLMNNGVAQHEFNSGVTVGLPISENETNIKIYDIEKDVILPHEERDGYAYFTTNHFSEYGIVADVAKTEENEAETNTSENNTVSPKAEDTTVTVNTEDSNVDKNMISNEKDPKDAALPKIEEDTAITKDVTVNTEDGNTDKNTMSNEKEQKDTVPTNAGSNISYILVGLFSMIVFGILKYRRNKQN